jgi:hypothetical protein
VAEPKISHDGFWADVINGLLLKPVYRQPRAAAEQLIEQIGEQVAEAPAPQAEPASTVDSADISLIVHNAVKEVLGTWPDVLPKLIPIQGAHGSLFPLTENLPSGVESSASSAFPEINKYYVIDNDALTGHSYKHGVPNYLKNTAPGMRGASFKPFLAKGAVLKTIKSLVMTGATEEVIAEKSHTNLATVRQLLGGLMKEEQVGTLPELREVLEREHLSKRNATVVDSDSVLEIYLPILPSNSSPRHAAYSAGPKERDKK